MVRLSAPQILLLRLLSIVFWSTPTSALQYVSHSPCENVCSDDAAGPLTADVVCLDSEFVNGPGQHLQECVTCQLNSTAVDPATNTTDVEWALYNLRYSLANCMFAFPIERVSISSPCQVTCQPLLNAITSEIPSNPNITSFDTTVIDLDFCSAGQFDDTTINNCAFCYSFIPQQLFLGNFLQALHIACHSPPVLGRAFYPDGKAIFNHSTIAGPTGAKVTAAPNAKIHGSALAVAIALPIVGFLIILIAGCYGCFHFTRKRRSSMAASGRMSRFHDNQATSGIGMYSPMSSKAPDVSQHGWSETSTEMETIRTGQKADKERKMRPNFIPNRWRHTDDEAGAPLNSADREAFARGDSEPAPERDQFIGSANNSASRAPVAFRAQDGLVQNH